MSANLHNHRPFKYLGSLLRYHLFMNSRQLIAFAVCLSLAIAAAGTSASPWPGELLLAQSEPLSQDEAAAKVREDTGGRILDVQAGSQDGLTVYVVKVLLPDGRVREVTVRSK